MSIKLKNNKRNYLTSIIVYLIILMTAIGLVVSYPKIADLADNKEKPSYFESSFFQRDLYRGSYILYKDILEKAENKEVSAYEIFYKENDNNDYGYDEDDIRYIKQRINDEINGINRTLKRELKNLDYYAIDKKTNITVSNTDKNLNALISNEENKEVINSLDEYYGYYMVIDFDEQGNVKVNKIKGANSDVVNTFLDFQWRNIIVEDNSISLVAPKNLTVVYGVPNELKYIDRISSNINMADRYAYGDIILVYALIAYGFIIILSVLIPLRKSKDIVLINSFKNLKFVIGAFLIIFITSFVGFSPSIVYWTINNEWIKESLINIGISSNLISPILFIGNVLYWFVLLLIAFISIVIIKYIFYKGLKRYIKENTLIYKIYIFIKNILKKVYNEILNIDLNKKSDKIILKIVVVNLVIVIFMCSIWFFGIGISIIYSVILFILLRKYFEDIKNKYQTLLKATNKIAEGNLDVKIEENLGVFEPLKNELEKVQKGFKKAVEEEVKSQKMKTELISNVSHDLKTPLTSIITYIDLLKNENINEEDRKKYLDTLDRKSQRLKNLIEDLFEVSKATSKNIQLNIVDIDIVSLMKQTQLELSDKFAESSLKFKWNLPENKIIVPLDSQKTFRIFENLLLNIVKYSMPNSRVFIDIIDKDKYVYVTLKNMSANEIDFTADEITERFVRGDKSRNTEGSGLGLAIAKSFTELQDGTFNIEIDGDLFKVILKFNK